MEKMEKDGKNEDVTCFFFLIDLAVVDSAYDQSPDAGPGAGRAWGSQGHAPAVLRLRVTLGKELRDPAPHAAAAAATKPFVPLRCLNPS